MERFRKERNEQQLKEIAKHRKEIVSIRLMVLIKKSQSTGLWVSQFYFITD